ncbi:hypothetical protein NKH34_01975 [Mesorhizobium sp. M1148]|jgi:hypothetical protein|uniref:hypothetical protein n=1 Tax=unclassified Mesorhizobium TaxID=325217 RepID=UPI0003CE8204|nr:MULTISPECIES: hypothetical protein [unclassified Mesorhizobium]ESW73058.1 hypothetical protein X771_00725 [Mesorhizobium sp. LSJC277A00]ESX90092.1 hypothetical protein X756_06795 [Mesorhizobium sp. LSHC412B00]ESX93601.1 hypothetical protein X754_12725 [Mesorhizobium sp. LNJC403B00]ESY09030.1 hypothetical protein X752_22235 [Mesorhizobium sp. LNJC398B00]ESY20099.1 hypothetical protein X751_15475 [Mesorhizobium sp. LNJC395A00]
MRALKMGTSWGGLLSGPMAWAISTQLNYALVPWQCNRQVPVVLPVALVLAVLSLLGGALSWRAKRQGGAAFKPERTRSTEQFVADLGMLAALLFALVIIMQGSAALILDECLR